MSEQKNNLEQVLAILQELDKTTSFNVYIPSLKKEAKFKQLNTKQLKQLLKTNIDEIPIYNTKFILLLNQFIQNNCLDTDINVNNLTILDKFLILFKTRIESISPEYNFILPTKEKELYGTNQNLITVNIEDIYNKFIARQPSLEPLTIQKENYKVIIALPTIGIETSFEEDFHKSTNIEISTKEDFQNILANTFVNETAKYIQKIDINNTSVNLNDLDFNTRINVVEKLPATIINEVLRFIERYKNLVSTLTTCDITINNQRVLKEIPIDAAFFNI